MLEQIPCDRSGHFVIPRFRGPANTFECLNAAAVLQAELRLREGKASAPDSPSTNTLRDCHVLVGFSAPGLKDLKVTPVGRDYCGVEWNATVLDSLLERDFLREPGGMAVFPATLMLTSLAGIWMRFSRNARQALLLFIGFLAVPYLAGYAAYPAGWWWPVAWPVTAVSLSMLGTLLLNYAVEGRQKRFLRSAFRQYLSHEFIEQMLEHPEQLKLGGEKRELTMLFSDLEKFSSFSERLPPSELTALLNDYLTDMTRIIQEEGGTVDKFVGDAIVAFWNAPLSHHDHAARACRAALLCQRKLAERRPEFESRAGAPFRMRVGMNTGDVTVGNLGSETRFNYTVLGDAANLASRLEGANKFFGTFTMIADSSRQQAAQAVIVRQLGALRVVGRKTPVIVYEVTGLAGEPVPEHVRAFEEGLALCREKRWKDAEQVFARFPDDPPARLYRDKCHKLIESGSDWDMVWNLTEK
jgi:adenylate cyclase